MKPTPAERLRYLRRAAKAGESLAVMAHEIGADSADVRHWLRVHGLYALWERRRAAYRAAKLNARAA